jgi:integrating conjugative element protein (TIGR03761 family)
MTSEKTVPSIPGALRSRTVLQVQTRKAHALVRGRRREGAKPAIIGLVRFAALLGPIYAAAAKDDPWADWWLLKVERELTQGKEELAAMRGHLDKLLHGRAVIDVEVAHCEEPVKVDLTFRNPYGFLAAYLVADYDELVLAVLTARHVSLLGRKEAERLLDEGGRLVRRAFHAADGYRHLAVSREDLRQGTARGLRARETLGELPQEVLEGTLRAEHAPAIGRLESEPIADAPAWSEEDWEELESEKAGAAG